MRIDDEDVMFSLSFGIIIISLVLVTLLVVEGPLPVRMGTH